MNGPNNSPAAERKHLARRVVEEVCNAADDDAVDELLAPDVLAVGAGTDVETGGREAILDSLNVWRTVVPDSTDEIDAIVAEGDRVVVFATRRGTVEDAYGVIPAAAVGSEFEVGVVHRFDFEDGQVIEWWRIVNAMAMARQLGVLPDSPTKLVRLLFGELQSTAADG